MNNQEKQIIRVCGENYQDSDIPALWREDKPKSIMGQLAEIKKLSIEFEKTLNYPVY